MNFFTVKNRSKETHLFKGRLIVAVAFVALLAVVLVGRLIYLQCFQYQHFVTLSKNNEIDLVPMAPRRGLIYDRNGVVLAQNVPVFSLMVVPSKVKDLKTSLDELKKIIDLDDKDIEQFDAQLKQHRRFEEIPLKLELTKPEVARFSVNRYRFLGMSVKAQLIRHYPWGNVLAHVVGHIGRINENELKHINQADYADTHFIGKLGIEKSYEHELHGTVGYRKVEKDATGRIVRTLDEIPPMRGDDLYLTIDSHLQIAATKALEHYRGAVVAVQPTTGDILALVSQPTYNPNLFINGISHQDYLKLQNDKSYPLYNRALRGLYAPGSTIKPFIALAGLDSGVITTQSRMFDPGWYKLPNVEHIYHDWRLHGHHWVDLTKAIVQSCDTYFYDLAYKLGIKRISAMLDQFGFGQLTDIEVQEELAGNLPTPAWKLKTHGKRWYVGDTIVVGIGQGYLQVTPLQLATATAILANRGIGFKSHLLYAFRHPGQDIVYSEPMAKSAVLLKSERYWNVVIDAMVKVITEGTGHRFGTADYAVAAKTGTAQVVNVRYSISDKSLIPERFRNNSVFIIFSPVKKPEIALAVLVENSDDAPIIARKVLDYYFQKSRKTIKNGQLEVEDVKS
jgi:penicillin-binding protein 2